MAEEEQKEPRKVEDEIKETIQANAEVLIKTKAHVGDMIYLIDKFDWYCKRGATWMNLTTHGLLL